MRIKEVLLTCSDAIFLGIMVYLFYNVLQAQWTLDPLWDLFYARITGPIFQTAHASSMLFILAVAADKIAPHILKTGHPSKWMLAALSTVSMHELTLDLVKATGGIGFLDSYRYMAYLVAFLVLSLLFCSPYQKRVLLVIGAVLLPFFILTGLAFHLGVDVIDFNPGPYILDPTTNVVEVASWLIPSALWFLPERWFARA